NNLVLTPFFPTYPLIRSRHFMNFSLLFLLFYFSTNSNDFNNIRSYLDKHQIPIGINLQEEWVTIFWIFEVLLPVSHSDHVALDNDTVMLGTSERWLFWLLLAMPF